MKITKSVNRLGTEAVYNIFAKTKKLAQQGKQIVDLSLYNPSIFTLLLNLICYSFLIISN